MDQFKNSDDSHVHSKKIFDLLYEYDDFLDSLGVIADMGCGTGADIGWWSSLNNRETPPEPHNYTCYAVDKNIKQLDQTILSSNRNIVPIEGNFESGRLIPRQIDLLWCHDAFQYAINPLATLKLWNENMNVDGMMILSVPQHQSYQYNRLVTRGHSGSFYHYNICNLMYMLAVNGFDCRDCYFKKDENDSWLYAAVYKSSIPPMAPLTTNWYDLIDNGLVGDTVAQSMLKFGHVRQEELIVSWFDRNFHRIKT